MTPQFPLLLLRSCGRALVDVLLLLSIIHASNFPPYLNRIGCQGTIAIASSTLSLLKKDFSHWPLFSRRSVKRARREEMGVSQLVPRPQRDSPVIVGEWRPPCPCPSSILFLAPSFGSSVTAARRQHLNFIRHSNKKSICWQANLSPLQTVSSRRS